MSAHCKIAECSILHSILNNEGNGMGQEFIGGGQNDRATGEPFDRLRAWQLIWHPVYSNP